VGTSNKETDWWKQLWTKKRNHFTIIGIKLDFQKLVCDWIMPWKAYNYNLKQIGVQ
jgi:hypothetical protein